MGGWTERKIDIKVFYFETAMGIVMEIHFKKAQETVNPLQMDLYVQ